MSPKSRVAIGSGVAVVAVIGLVSCLAATNPSTATSSPSASAPASAAVSPKHNAQDMSFTTMMIVHHQGAIDMSALVPERASSDAVKTLAVQIQEAQGPEIQQMKGWLTVWKAAMAGSSAMPSASSTGSPMGGMSMPASSMPGMDHSSHQMEGMTSPGSAASSPSTMSGMDMPGMTPADMAQLKAARGTAFDRLFLQKMIVHHQAAVEMSKTELTHGTNPQAISLAADIISSQTAQITQMQNMLDGMK